MSLCVAGPGHVHSLIHHRMCNFPCPVHTQYKATDVGLVYPTYNQYSYCATATFPCDFTFRSIHTQCIISSIILLYVSLQDSGISSGEREGSPNGHRPNECPFIEPADGWSVEYSHKNCEVSVLCVQHDTCTPVL